MGQRLNERSSSKSSAEGQTPSGASSLPIHEIPQWITRSDIMYSDDRMCDDRSNTEQPSFLKLGEDHPEGLRSWAEDKSNLLIKTQIVFLVRFSYGFDQDLFDTPAFSLPTSSSSYLLLDAINQLDVVICIQQSNSSWIAWWTRHSGFL